MLDASSWKTQELIASSWCLELLISKLRSLRSIIQLQGSSNLWKAININLPLMQPEVEAYKFSFLSRTIVDGNWNHLDDATVSAYSRQLQEASFLWGHKKTSKASLLVAKERNIHIIIHVAYYLTRDIANFRSRSRL